MLKYFPSKITKNLENIKIMWVDKEKKSIEKMVVTNKACDELVLFLLKLFIF